MNSSQRAEAREEREELRALRRFRARTKGLAKRLCRGHVGIRAHRGKTEAQLHAEYGRDRFNWVFQGWAEFYDTDTLDAIAWEP